MSPRPLFPSVLVLALLSGGQARSQSPPPAAVPAVALDGPAVPPAPEFCQNGSGCQGPVGGNGPIGWETYLRSGVSLPFGGGPLARALDPGWVIQGGARSLFFNSAQDAAWTADFSVSNICMRNRHRPIVRISTSIQVRWLR